MANYKITVTAECPSPADAQTLAKQLQGAVSKIAHADLVRILKTINEKPAVVKTALRYI